jgi:ParB-like chromosome segregation protein Spo0J
MAESIREFGFKIPVLARSSGDVVDGHLRLKAAEKLGLTEIPVILCDDWSEAQVKAFRLLVNRSVTCRCRSLRRSVMCGSDTTH